MKFKPPVVVPIAAILATAACLCAWMSVSAASQTPRPSIGSFSIISSDLATQYNDIGAKGPSLGDTVAIRASDKISGNRVGSEIDTCTLASKTHALCLFESNLFHRGKVDGEGSIAITGNRPFTVAVTGGTGEFAGVHGTALVTPVGKHSSRVTFSFP